MNYIKGNIRHIIYDGDDGFKVGIIRVKDTNDLDMKSYLNKTVTFTGYFSKLNMNDNYIMYGTLTYNDKYGYRYNTNDYEREEVKGRDAVIEFLSSDLIKGCAEATATSIVDTLGENAIEIIKKDPHRLLDVPHMTELRASSIYESIMKVAGTDELLINLKKLGFSINEALNIINKYKDKSYTLVTTNPYICADIVDFKKLDNIYLNMDNIDNNLRIKYCINEVLKILEINTGSTYFNKESIINGLISYFNITEEFDIGKILEELEKSCKIKKENEDIYLYDTYYMEKNIAKRLIEINSLEFINKDINTFNSALKKVEEKNNFYYDEFQMKAIKGALDNRISIITGGPGTGKTTIVSAITSLYIKMNNIKENKISDYIALLAPTGRAAKRLASITKLPAYTIHKYLKWNKDTNEFAVNEYDPNRQKLIIIDEVSMIDTYLFNALLKGILTNIQLVFVGDKNQLPSVGPGLVLDDLINSNLFNFYPLEHIYRQSNDSYIPYLANSIREKIMDTDYMNKRDDYNFLKVSSDKIIPSIEEVCRLSIKKGLTDRDIQVLAPIYKGLNGIDSINSHLQNIFNPCDITKEEMKVGDIVYRVGDKVLQLVNDPDKGIYNGDIGYIKDIVSENINKKKLSLVIDFDKTIVTISGKELYEIKHAYCISIHKAQGSEFSNVIMPISKNYNKMLYNKLIYTGVSRAKSSLILIGDNTSFEKGVLNDEATYRNTSLKKRLIS